MSIANPPVLRVFHLGIRVSLPPFPAEPRWCLSQHEQRLNCLQRPRKKPLSVNGTSVRLGNSTGDSNIGNETRLTAASDYYLLIPMMMFIACGCATTAANDLIALIGQSLVSDWLLVAC